MGQFNLKLNIQKFASNGVHIVQAYETDIDVANNLSYIYLEVQASTNSSTYNNTGNAYVNITATSSNNSYGTGNVHFNISKNTTKTVWSGKLGPFYHNSDGSLGNVTVNVSSYITSSTKPSASTSVGMSTIQRYANINSLYTSNVAGYNGLHALNVHWGTDAVCDAIQYSLNGGGWTDTGGNPFTIWGLSPNQNYSIRIRVRRQDSQLWRESGYTYGTTKDINRISSENPNITNGQALRVIASNPSGANSKIYLEVPAGTRRIGKNGTDVTFSIDEINSMLQYIPGPTSSVRVTVDTLDGNGNISYSNWKDGTYTVVDSNPIFNSFIFEDINEKTLSLTGNNQDCIIGYSTIKTTIPVESRAIAKNYATMSNYRLLIGNSEAKEIYLEDEDVILTIEKVLSGVFTVYAEDSRKKSTPVTLLSNRTIEYTEIKKNTNSMVQRVNNSGSETGVEEFVKLTFSGSIWKGNFGLEENTITKVEYKYKKASNEKYTLGGTIVPTLNEDGTFSFSGLIKGDTNEGFDIANTYTILVIVYDKLSSATFTLNLSSGTPHVAYAKEGVSFMGKYNTGIGSPIQRKGDCFFPVGYVYFTNDSTNPSEYFGGTWVNVSTNISGVSYVWQRTK